MMADDLWARISAGVYRSPPDPVIAAQAEATAKEAHDRREAQVAARIAEIEAALADPDPGYAAWVHQDRRKELARLQAETPEERDANATTTARTARAFTRRRDYGIQDRNDRGPRG